MIKLVLILAWSLGWSQDKPDTVTVFDLDRNSHSGVRITESEIQTSFVDRTNIIDRQVYDSLSHLVSHFIKIDESSRNKVVTGLDVRLLVVLNVGNLRRTISIGKFDQISIDGNLVFDFDVQKIIGLLRPFLAPDLNWYTPTREELAKFKRKPQLRVE